MKTGPLLAFAALGLLALASSSTSTAASSTSTGPVLSRQECIDKWSDYLATKFGVNEQDPEALKRFVRLARAFGMHDAATCVEGRATDIERGGPGRNCYAVLYEALRKDFGNLQDPSMARVIAKQARVAGQPDLARCFEAMADQLEQTKTSSAHPPPVRA